MSELTEQAQRLIELARGEDEPQPGAQTRIEQALAARLASGAGPIRAGATAAKSAAFAGRPAAIIALKAMLVGVGVGALVVGTWQVAGAPKARERSSVQSSTNAAAHALGNAVGQAAVARATLPTPLPVTVTSDREPELRVPRTPITDVAQPAVPSASSSMPERSAAVPVQPLQATQQSTATVPVEKAGNTASFQPVTDPLQAETKALRTAQRLLRDGNTQQALAQLAQQDLTYPDGALQEERAAARVLALCEGGQGAQAQSEAQRFAQRWPRSALLARVLSACRNP